jgi:hypothetical protein
VAVPLISREDVIRRLKEIGCTQLLCNIPDTTMWETPWGFGFLVPHPQPEGMLPEWVFNRIMQQVKDSKPPLH